MARRVIVLSLLLCSFFTTVLYAQFNAERVLLMGRNALYYEDYVLSIQRFNMVISVKPHLAEAYFYRGLAKFYLEDYTGADADCSSAIFRNPYAENYYVLRGLCRIHLGDFSHAESDYGKAIEINPLDASYWHNLALCRINQEHYESADSCLETMIRKWPTSSENYTMRAQVKLAERDTVSAEQWVDRALDINAYDGTALSIKSMMLLNRNNYVEGEAILDRAIVEMPRNYNLFLNRALVRYYLNNLRGAMNDYDAALELNNQSYIGHFNRGLLRAEVGDDNRAIEDFNYVIEKEPENFIAIYNRAILLDNVGDYRGSLRDITTILKEYPQFWDGYLMRARIRRKIGDVYGAERDEFKVLKVRVEGAPKVRNTRRKTRKASEHDMEGYDRLVMEDSEEPIQEYASSYRGRVQDNATPLQPLPPFVLSYYERSASVNKYLPYSSAVDEINKKHKFFSFLHLTNAEVTVPEQALDKIFADISNISQKIDSNTSAQNSTIWEIHRALNYYHVRDFESGIADLDCFIALHPNHQVALFLRAQLKYAALVAIYPSLINSLGTNQLPTTEMRLSFRQVLDDLNAIVKSDPKQQYAYYNMGNVYLLLHDYELAVDAFSNALNIDGALPDAYYNRGVAHILMGQTESGLSDLSQAGEYGLYAAYSLIKQYSKRDQSLKIRNSDK